MNRRRALAAGKVGAGALLLVAPTGCPGSLGDPAAFLDYEGGSVTGGSASGGSASGGSGACDAPDTIFAPTCAVSGCHDTAGAPNAGNLDLSGSNVASRLVNVPAPMMPSLLYIDTADPAMSVILTKLTSSPPFGSQMPYLGTPLSAAQIQCVTEWVDAQAASATDAGGTASSASGSSSSSGASSSSGSSSSSSSSSSSGSSTSSSSTSSSGSSSGSMEAGTVSFAATVYPNIIKSNCTQHHAGNNPSGGLDLSSESTAYQNLTTGSSTEQGCNEKYVVSMNATSSLLYQKVVGGSSLPSACGAQMPAGGAGPLLPGDITTIQSWIQSGAAP